VNTSDRDRYVNEPGHHHLSGHEIHEADAKRMAKMGWLAVGAMTLVALLSLWFVMDRPGPSHGPDPVCRTSLLDFRNEIMQVDINNEEAVKHAKEQIGATRSFWHATMIEPDILGKLSEFNKALKNGVLKNGTPKNLLDTPAGWQEIGSASLEMSFGSQGLTLTNEASEGAGSGGVSYLPGTSWSDYVLDIDFKLDSGTMVIYTRLGDKMNLEQGPGFSIGTIVGSQAPNVVIEYGKPVSLTVSTIGNVLTVTSPDNSVTLYRHELTAYIPRRGEPGIEAKPGTKVAITRLHARVLR